MGASLLDLSDLALQERRSTAACCRPRDGSFCSAVTRTPSVCTVQYPQNAIPFSKYFISHSYSETIAEQRSVLFEIKHCVNELPNTLGYTWEGGLTPSQRPVILRDALGQTLNLPLEFCESYDVRDFYPSLRLP